MPTYQYECRKCPHRFEKFQSIKARPARKCPECGGSVRRLIGAGAAVIFRGSGFYQTDYRSSEYQQKAKADKDSTSPKPAESSGDSKSGGASDSAGK